MEKGSSGPASIPVRQGGGRPGKPAVLLAALGWVGLCVLLGVCLGANRLNPLGLLGELARGNLAHSGVRILLHVRLPRVAGALLAGSALAAAGTVVQGVLGNPLASPNIIGVNAGAGLFVLAASALLPSTGAWLPFAAFAGALLAAGVVLGVSAGSGLSGMTVVLAGFAVTSIFTAGMNGVLILWPDAYIGAGTFLAGGLSAATWGNLAAPSIYIGAGLAGAVLMSPALNILSMGEERAATLGMRVPLCRLALLALAALLAGGAVSFGGMMGFVGLAAPHTARMLIGQDNRFVLPLSALLGAGTVTLCDLLARTLFAPYELPVGILLSLAGGPVFLLLVRRRGREWNA